MRTDPSRLTGEPVVDLCLELGIADTQAIYLAYKYSVEQAPYECAAAAIEWYRETGEADSVVTEFAIDVLSGRLDVQPAEQKALPKQGD